MIRIDEEYTITPSAHGFTLNYISKEMVDSFKIVGNKRIETKVPKKNESYFSTMDQLLRGFRIQYIGNQIEFSTRTIDNILLDEILVHLDAVIRKIDDIDSKISKEFRIIKFWK
jgi:hypothetical protein